MHRRLPVLVLFLLAPIIGEVLLGATPVSRLGGLLPLSALYGGGAVLVREVARRRGRGWGRVALLGAAYGLLEEGLGVQSLFNPELFHAGDLGGRALGVNWVWSEWTVGYHIIWSIAIPILITELLFRHQRDKPWLGRAGTATMAILYVLGLAAVAAIFRAIVTPDFRASFGSMAAIVAISGALIAIALLPRPAGDHDRACESGARAPHAWIVGAVTFVA